MYDWTDGHSAIGKRKEQHWAGEYAEIGNQTKKITSKPAVQG